MSMQAARQLARGAVLDLQTRVALTGSRMQQQQQQLDLRGRAAARVPSGSTRGSCGGSRLLPGILSSSFRMTVMQLLMMMKRMKACLMHLQIKQQQHAAAN